MTDQPKTRSAFIAEMKCQGYSDKLVVECANIVEGYGGFDPEKEETDQPMKQCREFEGFEEWFETKKPQHPFNRVDFIRAASRTAWQAAKADTAEEVKRLREALAQLSKWLDNGKAYIARQALANTPKETTDAK